MDYFKFLIIGAGRGGTSLLASLIDYHSKVEVAFEKHAIDYLMGNAFPYQGPDMLNERVLAFLSACEKEASNYSGIEWGYKITTEQLFGLEDHNRLNVEAPVDVLETFFHHYMKDTKIIFILRDGRTCVNSKVNRTGQPMEIACKRWQYSVRCYQFLMQHHKNALCVRFEDLVFSPQAVLIKICEFLGICYEPEMLNGVANNKMLPEYINEKVDTSKTKSIELPEEYLIRIKKELDECGYV